MRLNKRCNDITK